MTKKEDRNDFGKDNEAIINEIKEKSQQVLQRLPALGPILALYLQSPHRRYQFISDIEWLVLPPLVRNQCKLYTKKEYPVSFVSWAFINKEVEQRAVLNGGKLRSEDWKSGERICLVDIIAPFGGVDMMLRDIQRNIFPGKEIHFFAPEPETGGITIRKLTLHDKAETAGDKNTVH